MKAHDGHKYCLTARLQTVKWFAFKQVVNASTKLSTGYAFGLGVFVEDKNNTRLTPLAVRSDK